MKLRYVAVGLILFLFALSPLFAASMEITQSGADAGTVMKGQFFTITVSGLSGSGSVSLIDTPSGFSSDEGTTKSFSDGTDTVTWTTAKISMAQSALNLKASVSVEGSPSIAQSSSFDVVLPPSITLSASPEEVEVNKSSSYVVTLNVQNLGGTSAKSISFSVSGGGMTATCPTISSLAVGASSSATCTVTAATAGTITTTFTAEPSNCDSKSGSVIVTVRNTGGSQGGNSNNGGTTGGVGGASIGSFWTNTIEIADNDFAAGISEGLTEKQRTRVKVGAEYHYIGVISLTNTSATINVSSDPQQATLNVGEEKKFDVSSDGYYDIYIKLNGISNSTANLTIKQINEKIPANPQVSNPVQAGPSNQASTTNPTTCTEGAKRCSGSNIESCENGGWVIQEVCRGGCNESTILCNPSPTLITSDDHAISPFIYGGLVVFAAVIVLLVFFTKGAKKSKLLPLKQGEVQERKSV